MVPLEEPDRLAEILTKWYQQQQLEMEKKKMTASRPVEQANKDADLKVYTLRRGSEGEGRLNVLNGIYNDNSETFLLANNISSAKQVLDIGCGTGQMACWIAQRNPDCHVTCLDISPDQIRVARRNAEKKGLTNISFDTVSVYELEKLNKQYDFIYTRFVLAHLDKNRTEEAFASIKSVLAPGGVLAIEEAKTSAHLCNPASETFQRYYKLWSELRMKKGSNPNLGSQLKDFMELVGLDAIVANEKTRDLTVESGLRSIFILNLQEIGTEAIAQNLITKDNLDTLIAEMSELIKDESLQMRFSASIQTAGKAPALENKLRRDSEPEVAEPVSRMGMR
jgi:2-polyprenyl-3-methyl-5-hydroxy-6-metoxy-1,4-benzoquinol methylase